VDVAEVKPPLEGNLEAAAAAVLATWEHQ